MEDLMVRSTPTLHDFTRLQNFFLGASYLDPQVDMDIQDESLLEMVVLPLDAYPLYV